MTNRFLFASCAAVGMLISGCAKNPPIAISGAYELMPLSGLPVPAAEDVFAQARPNVIGPQDQLSITVWGIEGLDAREVRVNSSGSLSFPIAGNVMAAGRTPAELEELIAVRLRAGFVRDPRVTVNIIEAQSQTVTVDGEVGRPGIYPVIGSMSLLKSIASAQGTEEYARDEVVVFREVGGRQYAAVYNLEGIRLGNYPDPAIYAGDVVVVGDSPSRRRLDLLIGTAPALLSPLVLLIR